MKQSDGGKGSSPRPFSVSNEEYAKRWEAIFGREDVEKIVKDAEKYLANEALNKKAENAKELGLDYD
jgi:hypothetical protein